MTLKRACGPSYTILGLGQDTVYGPSFVIHLVLQEVSIVYMFGSPSSIGRYGSFLLFPKMAEIQNEGSVLQSELKGTRDMAVSDQFPYEDPHLWY